MAADPGRWADLPEKLSALATVARDRNLDTLVLREPANLTWLLGARVNVPQTLDSACLDVVVDVADQGQPRITVVTNAIEAPRLRDTELAGLHAEWDVVAWWEGRDPRLPRGDGVGSDRPLPDTASIAGELAAVRRHLTDHQQGLLRQVCVDAAGAATDAAAELAPTTTEFEAAGAVRARTARPRAGSHRAARGRCVASRRPPPSPADRRRARRARHARRLRPPARAGRQRHPDRRVRPARRE